MYAYRVNTYKEKWKHVAVLFTIVLLAECGEFLLFKTETFLSRKSSAVCEQNFEIPGHLPDGCKNRFTKIGKICLGSSHGHHANRQGGSGSSYVDVLLPI